MRPGRTAVSRNRFVMAIPGAALALAVVAGRAAEGVEAAAARCQELRLQLAAERARILREDPEAVALRRQIEKLYRDLDRVVSSRPAVARLQADLARLEQTLKTQAAPSGAALRPGEGRAP